MDQIIVFSGKPDVADVLPKHTCTPTDASLADFSRWLVTTDGIPDWNCGGESRFGLPCSRTFLWSLDDVSPSIAIYDNPLYQVKWSLDGDVFFGTSQESDLRRGTLHIVDTANPDVVQTFDESRYIVDAVWALDGTLVALTSASFSDPTRELVIN